MALLPVADALTRILDGVKPLGSEAIALERAADRVLAEAAGFVSKSLTSVECVRKRPQLPVAQRPREGADGKLAVGSSRAFRVVSRGRR